MIDPNDIELGVDPSGFLAGLLTGYKPHSTIREQAQNADNACLKQGRTGRLSIRFTSEQITIENPSLLEEEDWKRLARAASRGKAADAEQTGEFGVGFWSVLHLTDAPIVSSGGFGSDSTRFTSPRTGCRSMSPSKALGSSSRCAGNQRRYPRSSKSVP